MSYASVADVEQRLGSAIYVQLTDDAGSGSADEGKVTEALSAAEGEVDSYLGCRYAVPIDLSAHDELAALLKNVTLDLAEYRLHVRRPPVSEEISMKKEAALKWLQRVAAGQAILPAADQLPSNPAGGIVGEAVGTDRIMTGHEMHNL